MILLLGMEDMNVNSGAFYGVNMAEYGHNSGVRVGSMMALMTEQEQEHEEASSMAFPSCNNGHVEAALLSAAAIFHGGGDLSLPGHHHSKHPVGGHFQSEQLPMNEQAVVFSDSSLSSVKTEIYSNSLELASKGEGAARWSFWPDPSLVLRALSQSQYQQQQKQVMATSLEAESECCSNPKDFIDAMKIRIAGHPNYPRLLAAYIDCHKIGTSPEVIALLDEISEKNRHGRRSPTISIGADPELDQFMEAYYSTLGKHQIELSKTFKEAMAFINEMETRLNSLGIDCPPGYFDEREEGEGDGGCGSSEEELSCCGELEFNHDVDPRAEDRQLKDQLLRKYSGYFSTLKKEFLKKRKKGKLPKEARQTLLEWWHLHNKWPYPSETDKVVLAESTGLDQKQINNWFINQRKRHWKPSEDMQLMVMDGLNSHTASFFIDGIDC